MFDYNTYYEEFFKKDLHYARQFIFSFGSNYALGTRMFKKDIREKTMLFYAFVRYADELIDNPNSDLPGKSHSDIFSFVKEWKQAQMSFCQNYRQHHPLIRSIYGLFIDEGIPFEYIDDFFDAMLQDDKKKRYQGYAELEKYMWGSASVVGHVMTFFVGYKKKEAFSYAKDLAEAMQLANFLRDVHEDIIDRDRVYLPQKDMFMFGVHDVVLQGGVMTPELYNLMRYYGQKTERLFASGINGIHFLEKGKFPIYLASVMYRENLRILRRRKYNIFGKKIRLSSFMKISLLIRSLLSYPFWRIKGFKDDL